jgi:hypothetical protein
MLIMALWEFLVIAALIGVLLAFVGFLTSRIGRMSAALQRIEAMLLMKSEPVVPAEMAAPAPEVTGTGEQSGRYLTMRDLKVRSELQRLHATNTDSESIDPIIARRRSETGNPFAGRLESSEAPGPTGETESSVAASSTSHETVEAVAELPSSPATSAVNKDSVTRKEQDAWLILNSQRRRRRTRYGY